MDLNLRKARKLEAKIQNHVATVAAELEIKSNVRVKGGLEAAKADIKSSLEKLNGQLELVANLLAVRFRIRRSIERANESTGINELLNLRAGLIESGKVLGELGGLEVAASDAELTDLLDSKALGLSSPDNHYAATTVAVGLVSEEEKQRLISKRKTVIKSLEDVEDQLSQKNLGASVELNSEDESLLRSQDLI